MRQAFINRDIPARDFASRPAARGVSPILLACVVLASGAAFGTAVQAALRHLGLDFASIHNDLIAGHAARMRSALAWWCWCTVPLAAFFVGPASAVLTRTVVANWWRLRALRLCVTAAAVVGLAAIGQLRPAPSTFAFTTNAVLGLLVVTGSTLLAALGARVLGSLSPNAGPVRMQVLDRDFAPLAPAPSWRGGGSAVAGLPFLRFRERHPLAPGPFSFRRVGLVAALAFVLFAVVSALGGASALIDSVAPGAVRELAASWLPPADSRARAVALALLPVEPRRRVVMPAVALLDVPPPKPVEPPEPRQRAISASVGYGGPEFSESELTFTKGYSRRRAAQLAANMTSLPSIPQLTAAINIKKIRAASLRFTQDRRVNRTVADNRYLGDNRYSDNRRAADKGSRASRQARGQSRYLDWQAHYGDYSTYDRHGRHDRRRARDHYGDNRFARAEPPYRRF
jgi:hypothetical protein